MKISLNKLAAIAALSLSAIFVSAQTDTVRIKTSSVCKTCKRTIEENLSFEKGVKKSNLDVKTKIVTVIYDSKKTNPDKIRLAITKSGYDADSLPRDPKAFKRLPDCCKNPDHDH
jgi:copper chaperone CopZ